MISIRKYLEESGRVVEAPQPPPLRAKRTGGDLLSAAVGAYRASLHAMGRATLDVCAATGPELDRELGAAACRLTTPVQAETLATVDESVRKRLADWSRDTARHFQQKAGEVKEILLVMAQTAESVGLRDQRCADQLHAVTANLQRIATLDDITVIRSSIERNAAELKTSIDRMTDEGKAVLDDLRARVTTFKVKLEEAERAATTDGLTRLRNRLWVEGEMEQRIAAGAPLCVAILDIDGFKSVNDRHGHVVGDELLKQFAGELKSACRSSDIVGRWGGDEFVILLDCGLEAAEAQIERVRKWVCGSYEVQGTAGVLKLQVAASIGLAEFRPPQTMSQLLERADAAMYEQKAGAKGVAGAKA